MERLLGAHGGPAHAGMIPSGKASRGALENLMRRA